MLANAWSILCESAVYILVGFLLAGLLEVTLSTDRVTRLLTGTRARSVFLATLIGVPLPLCSCSVLPTAVTLRKKGASRGAVLSFLISTPETGVTSILLTYALIGPVMAILRPIAACITALTAGLIENAVQRRFPSREPEPEPACGCECTAPNAAARSPTAGGGCATSRWRAALRYAFVDLFDDIFGWIVLGIVVAGAIQAWLPPDVLGKVLGGPWRSMLLMALIGVPLYVCAEASTPIAAALIAQGMSPGAALVLLLTGPATNIGSIGVLVQQLGRRTVAIYLATIVAVALLMGAVTNDLLGGPQVALRVRALEEPLMPSWLQSGAAVAFLAIGAASVRRVRYVPRLANWLKARLRVRIAPGGLRVLIVALLLATYAGSGFFIIRPGELGVHRRFGAVQRANLLPGWHYALPYPVDHVDRVPVTRVNRTVLGFQRDASGRPTRQPNPQDSWHLAGDENVADLQAAVHWGVAEDQVLAYQYGVADREALLRDVVLAATREVLSGTTINRMLTGARRHCEQAIQQRAQQLLDACGSGMRIHSFHILHAHAPPDVHAAFRDVASALEDRAMQIDQARTAETRLIPQARGEAAQKNAHAQGYAAKVVAAAKGQSDRFLALLEVYRAWPQVTSRRLEFEALERVLPKLRKYLKPADAEAGGLEIWLVDPSVAEPVVPRAAGP